MRLIDADALIDKTDDRYSLHEIGRREHDDIVDALEYAPTIQPEPQYKTNYGFMWLCPKCGLPIHSDYTRCVRCGHNREKGV